MNGSVHFLNKPEGGSNFMQKETGYTWKLGVFVITGIVIFAGLIYFLGKQKNIFGNTFLLNVKFRTVSGLKEGNNVRFAGINIGTVNTIELITDSSVLVSLVLEKKMQQFITSDALAGIGSDGLMGDKVLTLFPGTSNVKVKDGGTLLSKQGIEMEDVMKSLKTSIDNAGIITAQLAAFTYKINNGNGTLSKLIGDEEMSSNFKRTLKNLQESSNQFAYFTTRLNSGDIGLALDSTMYNIKESTKGLNENMKAAQNNILLRGYFNKKKKAEAKEKKLNLKKSPVKIAADTTKKKKDDLIKIPVTDSIPK